MEMSGKSVLVFFGIVAVLFAFIGFTNPQTIDDWDTPAKYKNMENKFTGEDIGNIGEDLYKLHCKSCHGREGYGDGPKGFELETEMRDLTFEEVQAQSDGELYYKSIIGRYEMPNYEKIIKDEKDRWMLINYIRSLVE